MKEDNRIPIVIGVTGHRAIRAEDEAALKSAVRAELEKLMTLCPNSPPVLLTSLAEGADLLCADTAEALGIPLCAVLPAERTEYAQDFDEAAKARFFHHIARAEQVFITPDTESFPAVNGDTGASRSFRFRQAGIYIAAHCHVLLALWDGGGPGPAGCGTAETVDFALHGGYLPQNGAVPFNESAAVIHVFTPRGERKETLAGTVCVLGNEDSLKDILSKTDEFNRLAVHAGIKTRSVLPDHTPETVLDRMDLIRNYAGDLSRQNARLYRRILAALALAGALLAAAFLLYDEAQAIRLILVCGMMLLLAWGIARYADRSACHRRYLEYRALAECLRVQIFLRYAGSGVQASDLLTWTQREETAWIGQALRALTAGPPAVEAHDVRTYWVESQKQYHRAAGKRAAHRSGVSERVVRIALLLSVILYLAAVAFELLSGGVLRPALLPVADAEMYRTFLKIALGMLSVVTLLTAGYYGNLSLPRALSDHHKLEHFYTEMGDLLTRFGQTDELLMQIAREELIENGNWCSYQRDNSPDFSI